MTDFKTLLPRNRTSLEINIEQTQSTGLDFMPVPLRELWRVDSCPAELLPWLAWSLSVDVWEDSWSDHRKREVIRRSVDIHRHKGTLYAVEQAIESLGIEASITEWWQDKAHIGRGRFHIEIDAQDQGINSGVKQQTLRRFIDRSKRLSALYALFAKDNADLNITASNAAMSIIKDRNIPIMNEQATLIKPTNIRISGHFKELTTYQPFSCLNTLAMALEISNQRTRNKPDLAVRVVSKDTNVSLANRIEASATLTPFNGYQLNAQVTELSHAPEGFKALSTLAIAFQSSNRQMAQRPGLALRVTTRDIAIQPMP